MSQISKDMIINVPAEKVFAFVSNTPNLVEVWPSLVDISDWKRDDQGLGEFRHIYQMAGFRYSGTNRDIEFIQDKKIVTESKGGLDALVTWEFEPVEGGTKVTFTGD